MSNRPVVKVLPMNNYVNPRSLDIPRSMEISPKLATVPFTDNDSMKILKKSEQTKPTDSKPKSVEKYKPLQEKQGCIKMLPKLLTPKCMELLNNNMTVGKNVIRSDPVHVAIDIKSFVTPQVLLVIKESNSKLNYKYGEKYRLIISGGEALSLYFKDIPELRTNDIDIKIAPYIGLNLRDSSSQNTFLLEISNINNVIINYLREKIINYLTSMFNKLNSILSKHGYDVLKNIEELNKMIIINNNGPLSSILINIKSLGVTYFSNIIDLYSVDPRNLSNYGTFIGIGEHNSILSRGTEKYYIPSNEYGGLLYAKLGYIVWDTYNMINISVGTLNNKLDRYARKFSSIILALNNMDKLLSCWTINNVIEKCTSSKNECLVNATKLISNAQNNGILPDNKEYVQYIINELSVEYLCDYIERNQNL